MTRDELIAKLNQLLKSSDTEWAHGRADDLLLEFINDPDISAAYEAIEKWYS